MQYWAAVVDDDPSNLKAAEKILSLQGYKVSCLDSGEQLLEFIKDSTPDVILLDLHMEGIDGFETLSRLQQHKRSREIPVIFLTADDDSDTETKALVAGARDFVTKPITASVLIMRVKNTIDLMRLQKDLKREVTEKTEEILAEHKKFESLSLQIVQTLAGTIDAKDNYTRGHSGRVAEYAREIAKRAGYSEKQLEDIYMMGLLHDVGKIGVSDTVINKPSRLTEEEFEMIKTHPEVGYEILKNITEMPKLAIGARWHHERYDGTGYPDGLAGKNIPEEARIIAVADAYDAMSSRRSYHEIFAQKYIISELEKGKGTQFDPYFANIMLSIIDEDKDYTLRENTEDIRIEEGVPVFDNSDESKFNFLNMLEVGGLNTAIGLRYCMNDVDFYAEMLDEFVTGSTDRIEKLDSSRIAGDCGSYNVYVHSLKSASKTIGAERLSDSAKALEDAAKEGRLDYIDEHHDELIALLRSTVGGILMATGLNRQ
ncbi:MAG: response regulator [Ruminococcus sp.]|nr:response regulator [Ruminococcus sp.]